MKNSTLIWGPGFGKVKEVTFSLKTCVIQLLLIAGAVINKVYFPVLVPVGIIGNILSFLVSFYFSILLFNMITGNLKKLFLASFYFLLVVPVVIIGNVLSLNKFSILPGWCHFSVRSKIFGRLSEQTISWTNSTLNKTCCPFFNGFLRIRATNLSSCFAARGLTLTLGLLPSGIVLVCINKTLGWISWLKLVTPVNLSRVQTTDLVTIISRITCVIILSEVLMGMLSVRVLYCKPWYLSL